MKKEYLKRILTAVLVIGMGIGLMACGGKKTADDQMKFYRAQYQEDLPDTFKNLRGNPFLNGDTVYYSAYDDQYMSYGVYSYNLTTKESTNYFKSQEQTDDPLAGGMDMESYTVDEDGNIYMYARTWTVDTTGWQEVTSATFDDFIDFMVEQHYTTDRDSALTEWNEYLEKSFKQQLGYVDAEGNVDFCKIINNWSASSLPRIYSYEIKKLDVAGNEIYSVPVETETEQTYTYVNDMIAADGNLYMYMNQYDYEGTKDEYFVMMVDATGEQMKKCMLDSYGSGLTVLADGRVGALAWNEDGTQNIIHVIDPQKMEMTEEISLGNNYISDLTVIDEDTYLISDSGALYTFNLETQEKELYLNWVDADLTSNSVRSYQLLEDGKILVVTQSYDYTTYENLNEIAILEEIPEEEAADIEILTLACINTGDELEQRVIKINKRNPETRIRIKQFYTDWSMDYEDALAGFMTAIASDSDVDLVYFNSGSSYAHMMDFAAKGLLIDLGTFLDSDKEVKREDLMANILELCTYEDKLVGLPTGFGIRTVIGKVSDVGTEPGWTFAEMKALLESKEPGTKLFYSWTRDQALRMCMNLGYKQFIDAENVDCNFDCQEFIDVLEFANLFPEEYQYTDEQMTTLMNTGKVLLAEYNLADFEEIQLYTEIFGEELTYIGYPTVEGNGAMLSLDSTFGITKNCEAPEVAWKLIREYFLPKGEENGHYYSYNFSIRQDEFDKFCERAMSEENKGTWGWDEFEVEIQPATQEQVDEVKDLIANTTAVDGAISNEIMNIISEEAAGYFSGQKTAKDVAGIIQSRVWVYLSETN